MTRTALATALIAAALAATGCTDSDAMSGLEALAALQEVNQSSRGQQATSAPIEISTDFTIGDAIESAAETIAEFWESQADCTEVTVAGNTVTIDYGILEDPCVYNGYTYAGINTVAVESTDASSLEVVHTWTGFTNGDVILDGEGVVTWSSEDLTRRVVTEHTWTDLSTDETVDVWGDHLQGQLEENVTIWNSGFTMEGSREWLSSAGEWTLDMSELELRMVDPAPQAGSLSVINPDGKTLDVVYERLDDNTIQAILSGLRTGDRVYHISSYGQYEDVTDG